MDPVAKNLAERIRALHIHHERLFRASGVPSHWGKYYLKHGNNSVFNYLKLLATVEFVEQERARKCTE